MARNESIYAVGGGWGSAGPGGRGVTSGAEIARLAGLDYSIGKRPVYDAAGQQIKGYDAVVREDTGAVFQVARKGYGIVQITDSLSILDAAVNGAGASFTSAGSFHDGAQIFACACLPDPVEIVPGDEVYGIATLFDSFDGSLKYRVKLNTARAICRNTFLHNLHEDAKGYEFALKHTASVEARARQAADALQASIVTFHELAGTYKRLAASPYSEREMHALASALVPAQNEASLPKQAKDAREAIVTLFEVGKGQELAGVRGTRWAALNAVTEYVDHLRPTRIRAAANETESRLASAWLGSGAAMKNDAFEILTATL